MQRPGVVWAPRRPGSDPRTPTRQQCRSLGDLPCSRRCSRDQPPYWFQKKLHRVESRTVPGTSARVRKADEQDADNKSRHILSKSTHKCTSFVHGAETGLGVPLQHIARVSHTLRESGARQLELPHPLGAAGRNAPDSSLGHVSQNIRQRALARTRNGARCAKTNTITAVKKIASAGLRWVLFTMLKFS